MFSQGTAVVTVTVLDTTAATVHILYWGTRCRLANVFWQAQPPPAPTHRHTCYISCESKTGFCQHLRVLSCWTSHGSTSAASTGNGPETSESREPSNLISLTGIKLSLIYDPGVCVINSNEWRQDATGAFLLANMTFHLLFDLKSDMTPLA